MFEITMFNFVIILYSKYNSIREIPPSNRGAGEDGGGGGIYLLILASKIAATWKN